ncbi:hypothetical protein [Paraflavitalea speifideaquila]|uniref:hypothetical protein n=1 Tax=Paraflavitalea speifideaquila TaxID=3076558 RepID=UPI0028E8D4F9|nr:hypothetical protein [Paraflavitalea speifideiaquila]
MAEHNRRLCRHGRGQKTTGNENTGQLVLEFYVNKKKDNLTEITNPVPAFINYGGINIPTDVKEKPVGIKPQWRNPGGDHLPARPGESVSRIHQDNTGTMSLKVTKSEPDGSTTLYMLSCYHVLFGSELANGILEVKPPAVLRGAGKLVTPGTLTGLAGHTLAQADFGYINDFVDAAVARLDDENSLSDRVDELGEPEDLHAVNGEDIGTLKLSFCGAMSGKRTGIGIKACGQTRPYNISAAHPGLFLKDLIELEKCSEEGDSGAPVMDDQKNIIGIIIGADLTSTYVVPIQNIINNLKVFPHLKLKNN